VTALLYLVRHGETDWNRERRLQGSIDVPLNDDGRHQASRVAERLSVLSLDAVVSSPLARAHETAQIIAVRLGLPRPSLESGLVERSYGIAEGMTRDAVATRFPPPSEVPGRETPARVLARAGAALSQVASAFDRGNVVVATHGAVIRAVVTSLAPGVADTLDVPIDNCSVHSVEWDPEGRASRLVRFDDPLCQVPDHVGVRGAASGAGSLVGRPT
jgi:uncharacterized phosphatase